MFITYKLEVFIHDEPVRSWRSDDFGRSELEITIPDLVTINMNDFARVVRDMAKANRVEKMAAKAEEKSK